MLTSSGTARELDYFKAFGISPKCGRLEATELFKQGVCVFVCVCDYVSMQGGVCVLLHPCLHTCKGVCVCYFVSMQGSVCECY